MDAETDLFVQAFWVKCRETIRPGLDEAVDRLRDEGHEANISTLEFSPDKEKSPEGAPALILTVHPSGGSDTYVLRYRGDVPAQDIEVAGSGAKPERLNIAAIDGPTVKRQISACFGALLKS